MARIPKVLYQGQPGISNTTLYTVPSSKKTTITAIHACNVNSDTKHISFHVVKSGDSIADDVCIAKMQKVAGTNNSDGGGTWTWETPIPLVVDDVLSAICETASTITVTIIGFEEDA